MTYRVGYPTTRPLKGELEITGSKSQSNRILILQKLFDQKMEIENLSNSDDTKYLLDALETKSDTIDIGHAGTAMRFLTSYFALKATKPVVITGSKRMKSRPISILVDALNSVGADIEYLEKKGYPPLLIRGVSTLEDKICLQANVSSQYISSLMLIGGCLPDGLEIKLEGKITSLPYIELTRDCLHVFGIKSTFDQNQIKIYPFDRTTTKKMIIESDWSSASYHFSLLALSKDPQSQVCLSSYFPKSPQGDSALKKIYNDLGVESTHNAPNKLILSRRKGFKVVRKNFQWNLSHTPDLAQTIAVTCFGMGVGCDLYGLHTLKIKETDRLEALKTELTKLGARIGITKDSLHLDPRLHSIKSEVKINTYDDHRMAMSFAPLGLLVPIQINHPGVVSKSYPQYWQHLKDLNFHIQSNK